MSVAGVEQDDQHDSTNLGDSDSAFFEFNGVKSHHKICDCEREHEEEKDAIGLPMILSHGFLANVSSWDRVMNPLSELVGSKVLAYDRPGFGLTSRTGYLGPSEYAGGEATPSNPYSMSFFVLATLSFINFLSAQKVILMGHSAGCHVAINTYFQAPDRVSALILVAPAMTAPLLSKVAEKEAGVGKGNEMEDWKSNSKAQEKSFVRIWKGFVKLYKSSRRLLWKILKGIGDMIFSIYAKVLCLLLRSALAQMLVRLLVDKLCKIAIQYAWYDASQVTDDMIKGYAKPLGAKGWEMALLEYTLSFLTDSAAEFETPLARRLEDIKCPVLFIAGDTDRFIPLWNVRRLSQAVPTSKLEVIKNCGHLPHEERVEDFLTVVKRFLQGIRSQEDNSHKQHHGSH